MNNNPWRETIAIIAYHPMSGVRAPERTETIDVLVTAATVGSLVRQGCARVVIVFDQGQAHYVASRFGPRLVGWLQGQPPDENTLVPLQQRINLKNDDEQHPSALVFWPCDARVTDVRGKIQVRVPRCAIWTLYQALLRQPDDRLATQSLLGSNVWKFVYYTEQDSVLHASRAENTLSTWRKVLLEKQALLIPHRWQPIPHATDFSMANIDLPTAFFVPSISPWDVVHVLDNLSSANSASSLSFVACCDAGLQSTLHFAQQPPCRNRPYWYMCGLGDSIDSLDHLRMFTLVRLQQGTQLTLLAASEHARQCYPSRDASCRSKLFS